MAKIDLSNFVHGLTREVLVLWRQAVSKRTWSRPRDVLIWWYICVSISKTAQNRDILTMED